MSDQKADDTKSPFARRGARPFVGPAGGSNPARPFFKPAAPSTRPMSTPALPPRPALGTRAQPMTPAVVSPIPTVPPTIEPAFVAEQPSAAIALPPIEEINEAPVVAGELTFEREPELPSIEAALPVAPLRPTTPAQTFDITIPEPIVAAEETPAESATTQPTQGEAHWSVAVTPAYTPTFQSVIDEVPPADDVMSSIIEPETEAVAALEAPVTRPITSEMVAIDAFEAFETVWDATPEPQPTHAEPMQAVPDESVAASPLEDESLGSGIDAQQLWGDEITQDTGDYRAYEAGSELPSPDSDDESPIEAGWASKTTPELAMPAWLADDAPVPELFQEQAVSDAIADDLPPAAHEATTSSIVGSAPNGSSWTDPRMAAYAAFVTSPDGVPVITNAFANDKEMRGRQVSAALERLAERIRDGEIDVSSVAPEAPDAAMLASVLAALLGGSQSR